MTLVPLSRRDASHLPDDAPDLRGWEVRTRVDDRKVGKVDDLLLDPAGSPRLLDVDLGLFKKHILLPVQWTRSDRAENVVWIESLDREHLSEVPEYDRDGDVLSEDYETRLLEHYERIAGLPADGPADGAAPRHDGLVRLADLDDFRVATTSADPRGWSVVTGDGVGVGEVAELLVDTTSMKGRYLDVDVDEKELELEPLDRHVLLPVDRVRLDGKKKKVLVDGLFAEDFAGYPVYRGLPLGDDLRREVDAVFGDRGPRRHRLGEGEEARIATAAGEVRIRVEGDDIVVEKTPKPGA